jgi:hypothetical protein
MAKKFYIEKEVEYKQGKVDTWYYIKLETENNTQIVDLIKDDEEKANEMLEVAVNAWVPKSKSIIKEIVVEA